MPVIPAGTMDLLPGFAVMGTPHEPVDEDAVLALLERDHDMRDAVVSRIPTERDDTFAVSRGDRMGSGRPEFILKVEHPAEPYGAILFRARALRCLEISDPSIPATRLLPCREGALVSRLDSKDGTRWATLTTFLPGRLLARVPRPWTDALCDGIGETLARIQHVFEGLRDDVDDVPGRVLWDVRLLPELAAGILPLLGSRFRDRVESGDGGGVDVRTGVRHATAIREAVETAVADYGEVSEMVGSLPVQPCHGDFHPGNLMVEGVPPRLCGVLDFGDMHAMPVVCDLGTCLHYLVDDGDAEDPLHSCRVALDAFLRAAPEVRRADLMPLARIMEARAALTLLLPAFARISSGTDPTHYLSGDDERLHRLRLLQGLGPDGIRRGLGLE